MTRGRWVSVRIATLVMTRVRSRWVCLSWLSVCLLLLVRRVRIRLWAIFKLRLRLTDRSRVIR